MHRKRRPWIPRNRKQDRTSTAYTKFCSSVYERDGYKCICCSSRKSICAHHLNGWSWYPQGRYETRNAVTLCYVCHKKFHDTYGKSKNTSIQFEEFLKKRFKKRLRDIL